MKKTILFFPVEIGVAHISRSLAVAEVLYSRGHRVFFAIPKRKLSIFQASPVTFVTTSSLLHKDSLMSVKNLVDADYLAPFIEESYEIIKKHKPDCVVTDFNLSSLVGAYALRIPIVNITGSGALPYGCYFPNPALNPLIHKFIYWPLQFALWQMKARIAKALLESMRNYGRTMTLSEFFEKMQYIVPEADSYLPSHSDKVKVAYVGPLAWNGFRKSAFTLPPSQKKTIYLSFGGTGFDGEKLKKLSERLIENGYRVIVSSSTIADSDDFIKHSDLIVKPFINGQQASRIADLVICHGGYGTMCDAVNAGKPIVAIPFNPDQLLHAFRFQEYGIAVSTIRFSPSFLFDFLKMNWARFQNLGSEVPIEDIMKKVEYVFQNYKAFTERIDKHKVMFDEKDSAKKAADQIESVLWTKEKNLRS